MTNKIDADTAGAFETRPSGPAPRPSLLRRIFALFKRQPNGELVTAASAPLTLSSTVRLAWQDQPFSLTHGNMALELHPDPSITGDQQGANREWIVHAGRGFHQDVPRFIRISPGKTVLLGRSDDLQTRIFGFDGTVAQRCVKIGNRKGELNIQPLAWEWPTRLSAITPNSGLWRARRDNLMRLPEVVGHPLVPFDDDEALDMIRDVNRIMAAEVYREPDDQGAPGGVIRFPDEMTVVIMGDVHARADNILRVLSEGGMLAALERGEMCLILLGDLVHSEDSHELENMASSVFVLDLFAMLKRRFPEHVFYIRGNHDSFSSDVSKHGVPQGLLLRRHLTERRGKAYAAEIETLFDSLAFIVRGNGFAACHGAPVRSRIDHQTLVNIRRYPGIQHELTWNRIRHGHRRVGYGKGSVKRFRRSLSLAKHAPFIVAHTPLSPTETLWLNAGDIEGHHIVYSAHAHRVGALVMTEGQMTPLEFIPEPALAFLNGENSP